MTALYITDQRSYLDVQHQHFYIFQCHQLPCKVSATRVSHVLLFGNCHLSRRALNLAASYHIPVTYLCPNGCYLARLETANTVKPEYRTRQLEWAMEREFIKATAESMVWAKLHNCRTLLLQLNHYRQTPAIQNVLNAIAVLMERLPLAESPEVLRRYATKATTLYFQALASSLPKVFGFQKRTKQPSTDPINSLLNLGYTLLIQALYTGVQAVGLEAHLGTWHPNRDCCPALVADLMAEFSALLVDSLVVELVRNQVFTPEDFMPPNSSGGVYLYPYALKLFLKYWEEKLQTPVTHLPTGYQVSYRQCLALQIQDYLACLMGDVAFYRPMLWKL